MTRLAETSTNIPNVADLVDGSRIFNASPDWWVVQDDKERASQLAISHPEVIQTLVAGHVDGLAGSTSFNIDSTLRHGLVPTSLIKELGISCLGLEHGSSPYLRNGVHVVPWTQAGETILYAERRVLLRTPYDYVTPDNAEALAALDPSLYEDVAHLVHGDHMLGIIHEARSFVANREPNESRPFYPVVYGVDSSKLPYTTPIKPVESRIRGDTEIEGIVPPEAITATFVPEAYMQEFEQRVQAERSNIQIGSLEALRTLDKEAHGWQLPRQHNTP